MIQEIKKPAILILYGPSLANLDSAINHFSNLDVYWVTLNELWIAEEILNKINKMIDEFLWLMADTVYWDNCIELENGLRFQKEGGLFTGPNEMRELVPDIFKYNDGHPGFFFILKWLHARKTKQVFIFGLDTISAPLVNC